MLTRSASGYLASTDTTPTTYTSTVTFDDHHRVVTTDGPRTDIADVTQSVYFSDNDGRTWRKAGGVRTRTLPGLGRVEYHRDDVLRLADEIMPDGRGDATAGDPAGGLP